MDKVDSEKDCSLSQLTATTLSDWRYIRAPKNKPRTTAIIFMTRFKAKPMRNPITPPEPAVNKAEGMVVSRLT